MVAAAAELTRVSKTYPSRTPVAAVQDLTLSIAAGSIVAVMGASGSGKSTILNLMGGLDTPTSGSVVVGGTDLGRLNEAERSTWRRRQVAFVFQAYHLLPTLTCFQNIALPLHLQGLRRKDVDARVRSAMSDVGLTDRASHVPDELSGGERQRVAIARALVTAPKLLLADEPTGNLDSVSGHHVLGLLLGLTRARGATLVMVTHNREATTNCDRVITLVDGRIETDGRP